VAARVREQLRLLVGGGNGFDLAEAALLVAAEEYPDLDVARELGRLRVVAAEGARRVWSSSNPFARLSGMCDYLAIELGFRGNEDEYNDPRNSFLNEVLDRRLGNPLTLSIVLLETARAAGFDARGVGLPGHFVTRLTFGGRSLFVDAFHGFSLITEEDCGHLVARCTGRPSLYRRSLLDGCDERAMLTRLLLNLKHIYVKAEDYGRALATVERLLILSPGDATELRDRGYLHAHLGQPGAAVEDLETYLTHAPDARDADSVRGRVAWLRRRLSHFN
jgi:regulator of sirC expression with transglutaminase-like and TPR domain